jgi:hypothetical protein
MNPELEYDSDDSESIAPEPVYKQTVIVLWNSSRTNFSLYDTMEAAMVAFERDNGAPDEVLFQNLIESKVL